MPVRETRRPAPEEITMIRPIPAAFMPGVTARARLNAPSTFTAWIARQSASVTSSSGAGLRPTIPPAAWMAILMGPVFAITLAIAPGSVTSIA